MKNGFSVAILIAVVALRAESQELPCVRGTTAAHSTNREVLFFTGDRVTDGASVRVFDEKGEWIEKYDWPVNPKDPRPYEKEREKAFYPETRFVATTASQGCVRGVAQRPTPTSPCVAMFRLRPAARPPLRVKVDAPDGLIIEATLELQADHAPGRCVTAFEVIDGKFLSHDVIDGETIRLVAHPHGEKVAITWEVDTEILREKGSDQSRPAAATDLVRYWGKTGGHGRSGVALNQVELKTPEAIIKVSVK